MRRGVAPLLFLALLPACNDPAGLPVTPQASPRVVAIATSYSRACALTQDSAVWCWDPAGISVDSLAPALKPTPEPLVTLRTSSGGLFTNAAFCGQTAAGAAWCWGVFLETDVGYSIGDAVTPVKLGDFLPGSVAVGGGHACALAADSTAQCWGSYISGKRGIAGPYPVNNTSLAAFSDLLVKPVMGGERFVALAAGGENSCGLRPDGTLACWGDSASIAAVTPRFVHGDTTCWLVLACSPSPLLSGPLSGVYAVSAGGRTACAIGNSGLFCWGDNWSGQLGTPGSREGARPVAVALPATPVAVSTGLSHACALAAGGSAWCWGDNYYGQLGNGLVSTSPLAPTQVAFSGRFEQVSAGGYFTCGLSTEGRVYCWGATAVPQGWAAQPEVREVKIPRS